MSPRANRLLVYLLLLTLPFLLSGCFLRLLFGSVGQRNDDFDIVFIATIGGIFGPMATCDLERDGSSQLGECTYTFFEPELEEPFVATSSAQLLESFGLFGVLIDPLIVQVPLAASNYVATFSDGTITRTVVMTEATSFHAQPGITVTAEAGHKFLILEFPADVIADLEDGTPLNGPFDFDLEFQVAELAPLEIKMMYTAKIVMNGEVYYPPLLPCVTSFADVPAVTVPQAATNFLLQQQIIGALRRGEAAGCSGKVYDFGDNEPLLKLYMPSVSVQTREGS